MNSITICGNLTKDAETRPLPNGDPVTSFSVADNQGKDKTAIFWNCSLFGKRAESLFQYLTKGQAVTVIGSVSEREWTDKEGGKRKTMDVRALDVALQGGRKDGAPQAAAPRQQAPEPRRTNISTPDNFDDLDIPF